MAYRVRITSFGYLHGDPPEAHLNLNLRDHFRDPHVSPELKHMTAHDAPVRMAVLHTPGIAHLVQCAALTARAFSQGPGGHNIELTVGCAGGRHRAPIVAWALADCLRVMGFTVEVGHRDLDKPVVER